MRYWFRFVLLSRLPPTSSTTNNLCNGNQRRHDNPSRVCPRIQRDCTGCIISGGATAIALYPSSSHSVPIVSQTKYTKLNKIDFSPSRADLARVYSLMCDICDAATTYVAARSLGGGAAANMAGPAAVLAALRARRREKCRTPTINISR